MKPMLIISVRQRMGKSAIKYAFRTSSEVWQPIDFIRKYLIFWIVFPNKCYRSLVVCYSGFDFKYKEVFMPFGLDDGDEDKMGITRCLLIKQR
jgi:hypothetical protein